MHIIKISFDISSRPYYVRFNNNSWDEIYDPHYATVFSDKEIAESRLDDLASMKEYASIANQKNSIKDYDKWISDGTIRRTFPYPDPKFNIPYDRNKHTPYDVIEWNIWRYNHENEYSYEIYKTWPDLWSLFSTLKEVQAFRDRSQNEDMVFSFQMAIRPKTDFDTFQEELDVALKYITKIDKDGDKIIDIFDHILGDGGNFAYFHIHNNGEYSIQERWGENIRSKNLVEVFEYWKKYRYYD